MITPIEIQSKTFKSGGLGYDKKDVDAFFREVQKSYEQVYRENMELTDKVNVLTEGIQYYKTIEKTLQKALVLAEKTAEDTRIAAEEKAKSIEREARSRSQMIVAEAKNELERVHNQTIALIQQYEKYKVQFKKLAEAQMELIQSEPFNISVARLDSFIPVDEKANQVESASGSENENKEAYVQNHDKAQAEEYAAMHNPTSNYDVTKEEFKHKHHHSSKSVDPSGEVLAPEDFEAEEAEQEAAATSESEQYGKDEFDVKFDTSFMDSYTDTATKNQDDDDEEVEEVEDERRSRKKHKKNKKAKSDFSFFSLDDEED
ncbi:MAG: DivIVA domain-containing protein [Clostridiales bacterium]|nr:DivIVA domain-containing protein [Clostridiales bacterium]